MLNEDRRRKGWRGWQRSVRQDK